MEDKKKQVVKKKVNKTEKNGVGKGIKNDNKEKRSNINIVNPVRFAVVVIVFILFVILVIIIAKANAKIDMSKVEDISELNVKQYANDILAEYEKDGMKQKFIDDYDLVQGAVGLYIMNNSTSETDSFEKIITQLTQILKNGEWSTLEIDKPSFWNGTFTIEEDGTVKFTFASKDIEPSWASDEDISARVILND